MAYQKGRYGLSANDVNTVWKWWKKHKDLGTENRFASFDAFLQWAVESGYDYGKSLQLMDEMGPLSPENCRWEERECSLSPSAKSQRLKLEEQWDTFIAPFRRTACQLGLNPCQYCQANETCNTICPLRAVYWDAVMEKLRKELGA